MPLEIACFSLSSALSALHAFADRIELCTNLSAGGLTPKIQDLTALHRYRRTTTATTTITTTPNSTPIFMMIRPRGGDFTYSDFEFETMVASLIAFWDAGADGFVFRILTADGLIDEERNKRLLALAGAKPCTFHRAFDGVGDKNAGLEVLVRVGFAGVLTSGIGGGGAVDGKKMLRELVGRADGRIEVIPGGGVRSANLGGLVDCVGARWWHASAVVEGEEASEEELRALRALLNEKLL